MTPSVPPVLVCPTRRVAFTLCLNAVHHFEHDDYVNRLAPHFERWIFVEGACGNTGSTGWCHPQPPGACTGDGQSVDATRQWLAEAAKRHPNITLVTQDKPWANKDVMVNAALAVLPVPAWLWEIDADEQWTLQQLAAAEERLLVYGADHGTFECDYYLGPRTLARGFWGEARDHGYSRLWRWDGRRFKSHEPPVLDRGNGRTLACPQRFRHYAYYFEQDVAYKEQFYGGHEGILARWRRLQALPDSAFPLPIGEFLRHPVFGKTKTTIERLP